MTDLDIFIMKSEIAYLRNRIEELENGEVYTSLIREISELRVRNEMLSADSVRLEDIRRIISDDNSCRL